MQNNPYNKDSPDAKKAREEKRENARVQAQEVMEIAGRVLQLKDLVNYKKKYIKARELLIEEMLEVREPDPLRYALIMNEIVTTIRNMNTLLKDIEKDAKEEKK